MRILLAGLIAALFLTSVATAEEWGAIAYSPGSGATGFSYNWPDEVDAEISALDGCARSDCVTAVNFTTVVALLRSAVPVDGAPTGAPVVPRPSARHWAAVRAMTMAVASAAGNAASRHEKTPAGRPGSRSMLQREC